MNETKEWIKKTEIFADKYAKLQRMIAAPEIIADNRYWRKLLAEKQSLEEVVSLRERLAEADKEYDQCLLQFSKEKDAEIKKLISEELRFLTEKKEDLCKKISDRLASEKGEDEVLLELLPNGNKAKEYCNLLCDCLRLYAEDQGLTCLKKSTKPLTILFTGAGAGAYMREENGVHKFIDDAKTSTVIATVLPRFSTEKEKIDEKEIRIDLFHSGGAGGQNINKVETAIRITHLPTGIVVTCQDERSQLQNKKKALETLSKKLDALKKEKESKLCEELRQKAAETIVCTYYLTMGLVAKKNDKYNLEEYLLGKRRKL